MRESSRKIQQRGHRDDSRNDSRAEVQKRESEGETTQKYE